MEWPHTDRGQVCAIEMPAPAGKPEHLDAVKNAGIALATLASNHIFDQGPNGVEDTLSGLKNRGIMTTGAGLNLDDARKPAIVTRGDVRIGVLAYNCVGPRESWATPLKAGSAYIHIMTHYELEYSSPGSRPAEFSFPHPDHLEQMRRDIRNLRKSVDVALVVLHKGMLRIPEKIAEYERIVSRAAIDEGADAVIGHHAHILRGIEFYKGRPIYHGINHFVIVYADPSRATIADGSGINMHDRHSFRKAWREPPPNDRDPNSNFRYSADARNTMIVSLDVTKQGIKSAGFYPCWINLDEQPELVAEGTPRGEEVVNYLKSISEAIGSDVQFEWSDKRVMLSSNS